MVRGMGDPLLEKLRKTFLLGVGVSGGMTAAPLGWGVTVLSQLYTVILGWRPSYSLRLCRRWPGPGVLP